MEVAQEAQLPGLIPFLFFPSADYATVTISVEFVQINYIPSQDRQFFYDNDSKNRELPSSHPKVYLSLTDKDESHKLQNIKINSGWLSQDIRKAA